MSPDFNAILFADDTPTLIINNRNTLEEKANNTCNTLLNLDIVWL